MTTKLQWVRAPYPTVDTPGKRNPKELPAESDADEITEARIAVTPYGLFLVRDIGECHWGRRHNAMYRQHSAHSTYIGDHFGSFEEAMAACDQHWSEL